MDRARVPWWVALANLDLESAPWNARSIRSHFLRRFGVVVARGVGSSLVRAKWDGRVILRARGLVARNHPTVRPISDPVRPASGPPGSFARVAGSGSQTGQTGRDGTSKLGDPRVAGWRK